MKYIKKLNINFDNWDNIHNKYWYLNCYKYNNNNNIYITYIDIDNNNKINNKIEILYSNFQKIQLYKQNTNYLKKISFNIYVDINKVGSKLFKINDNDIYYLISNKDNITLSDISDEILIDFKNKANCDDNIETIKNKLLS